MEENIQVVSVKESKAPLYVFITILLALTVAYFFIPGVSSFLNEAWKVLTSNDEQKIENWVSQFGWIGPLVLILTMVLQMFLLVIPSIALMVVSILAYGPVLGSIIVFAAVFAASTVGYLVGRYLAPVVVDKLIGTKTHRKIGDFLEQYGFWAIIITRLNPILSDDAISFVAGILKMGYFRFIAATMLGITPLIIFIAVLGETTEGMKTGLIWGSVISLILFIAYVWWDKKKKEKRIT